MIIDAHHHLWDPAAREYPWLAGDAMAPIRHRYGLAELRAAVEPLGVDGTILVQTLPSVAETRSFLALSDPLIRGVVGWVDLTSPSIADDLATLPGPLVGIRHQAQDEPDAEWLARPDVLRGLHAVAAAGLTFDLLVLPHQLRSAITAVRAVPGGRFVLDHAAKPPIVSGRLDPWAGLISELAGLPNVACKLSGLVTEANWGQWKPADIRPYAEHVLDRFGPDRVLFGSDWPVCELAGDYPAVFALAEQFCEELTAAEHAAVLGESARSWYRL